jgi:hypothetical protein
VLTCVRCCGSYCCFVAVLILFLDSLQSFFSRHFCTLYPVLFPLFLSLFYVAAKANASKRKDAAKLASATAVATGTAMGLGLTKTVEEGGEGDGDEDDVSKGKVGWCVVVGVLLVCCWCG